MRSAPDTYQVRVNLLIGEEVETLLVDVEKYQDEDSGQYFKYPSIKTREGLSLTYENLTELQQDTIDWAANHPTERQ